MKRLRNFDLLHMILIVFAFLYTISRIYYVTYKMYYYHVLL